MTTDAMTQAFAWLKELNDAGFWTRRRTGQMRNVLPQLIGCVEMLQWYAEQTRVHCRQDIGPAWAPLYTKDDGQHARVALTALAEAIAREQEAK